jgi:uncharacterized protein (TIGR02145 family)
MKNLIICLTAIVFVLTNCKKEEDIQLATLTTVAVTNITINSAESGGVISSDGYSKIISKGIVWGKSINPTLESNSGMYSAGQGDTDFKCNLTNLEDNTDYYIRSFATNEAGTAYGNQQQFKTLAVLLSSVKTSTINVFSKNSALLNGEVSSDGGSTVTEKGFFWGDKENPETTGTKVKVSVTANQFSFELTGLEPGKTYYVKAYSINSKGQSVGNQISFKTDADVPTVTTKSPTTITSVDAVFLGIVNSDNGAAITERGFYYSKTENPEITGVKVLANGTVDFTLTLQNLEPNTTYYLKAFSANSKGNGYGNQISFKTKEFKLAIVNIKQESNWNYFVSDKDGNYFFLQEANSKPTKMMLHLYTSDTDIPVFFNANGFPEKVIIKDYIFIFSNHRSTYVDIAAIYPDGKIEVYKNIKTDVNWDNVLKSANSTEAWSDVIRWTGRVVGAVPCALSIAAAAGSGGLAIPLAAYTCGTYLIKTSADIIEDEFGITNGYTEFGKLVGYTSLSIKTWQCTSFLPSQIPSCLATLASFGLDQRATHLETLENAKKDKVNEANALLASGIKVTTNLIISNSSNSALVGGIATTDGVTTIIERGVYWGKSQNPEFSGTKFQIGSGTGPFSNTLTGLEPNMTYYVRAYAKSSLKTENGNEVSFKTGSGGGINETSTFTDPRDGKTYKTVKIGNQWWMAENLAYLPAVYPPASTSYTEPRYYIYGYSGSDVATAKQQANYTTYGVLYNWEAAKAACPPGWHLPSDDEWKQLEMALGMTQIQTDLSGKRGTDQGTQMKSVSGWLQNGNGSNSSLFEGKPSGYTRHDGSGFWKMGEVETWWTTTNSATNSKWCRYVWYNSYGVERNPAFFSTGLSVRCIKD